MSENIRIILIRQHGISGHGDAEQKWNYSIVRKRATPTFQSHIPPFSNLGLTLLKSSFGSPASLHLISIDRSAMERHTLTNTERQETRSPVSGIAYTNISTVGTNNPQSRSTFLLLGYSFISECCFIKVKYIDVLSIFA